MISKSNIQSLHYQVKRELNEAHAKLSHISPLVAIFGSARIQSKHPYYKLTVDIANLLSRNGYSVITGGGPGLMEAGNKGAKKPTLSSFSIGLNISLPFEKGGNPYQDISLEFQNFLTRKATFFYYSSAFIVMPGGYGTLDELSEILTLQQTGKIKRVPIILVNSYFWNGLVTWFKNYLLKEKLISKEDLARFYVVNEAKEILDIINMSV